MLESREEKERKELRMTIQQYAIYKDLQKEAKKLLNSRKTKEFKDKLEELNNYEKQCESENKEQANLNVLNSFDNRPYFAWQCKEILNNSVEGEIIGTIR